MSNDVDARARPPRWAVLAAYAVRLCLVLALLALGPMDRWGERIPDEE